jgi:hypothetical protein
MRRIQKECPGTLRTHLQRSAALPGGRRPERLYRHSGKNLGVLVGAGQRSWEFPIKARFSPALYTAINAGKSRAGTNPALLL